MKYPNDLLVKCMYKRYWFSGKISRCQRDAPGSIPGWRNLFIFFYSKLNCVEKSIDECFSKVYFSRFGLNFRASSE